MLEPALTPALDTGACPHLACLLRTRDELPSVLASFYALGAKRGGWLAHRAIKGHADDDRAELINAGLDVAALEDEGRLVIVEIDPDNPPDDYTGPWERQLERALDEGFSGLWYSRFAIGRDDDLFATALAYDRAWEDCFRDRPVVTLCPFIVGELDSAAALDRLTAISGMHSGVLVPSAGGDFTVLRRD